MTSDGETTKIKVVDLKKLYSFVTDNFFIWNHLSLENYVLNFLTFDIQFFQTTSDGEMTKPKL